MTNQNDMKMAAAHAALAQLDGHSMIGVGTGSTVNYFIDALASIKQRIEGAVASSIETTERLKKLGIPVFDLNAVNSVPVYVDGADEINPYLQMIKGGGGALTREKILATVATTFVCIVDQSKWKQQLSEFPLPIEVIPMARSYVARELVKLGGNPTYRTGFVTDNGNIILDVYNLEILEPMKMEETLNNITGVVCHGLFAKRSADIALLATDSGVKTITRP